MDELEEALGSELDEGLSGTADVLTQVREVIVGHRAALLAEDFSETAAEAMCVSVHNAMAELFFALVLKRAKPES